MWRRLGPAVSGPNYPTQPHVAAKMSEQIFNLASDVSSLISSLELNSLQLTCTAFSKEGTNALTPHISKSHVLVTQLLLPFST